MIVEHVDGKVTVFFLFLGFFRIAVMAPRGRKKVKPLTVIT